jgi:hypothetical protein
VATVFLYGTSLPDQPDHGWVADLPRISASVRGRLWCDRRRRPVLVPWSAGPVIHGALVDIPDARLPVMDLVEGAIPRVRVRVSRRLQSVEAWAWALDADAAKKLGYRPSPVTTWA